MDNIHLTESSVVVGEKTIDIGADIGNSDTKTQNELVASGFQEYYNLPFGITDYVKFNDIYYVIDESRMPYQEDKTTNNYFAAMILFAIAKEIVFQFKKKNNGVSPKQEDIDQYGHLNLGIGLPPKHFYLKDKTLEYCKNLFNPIMQFEYNNLIFRLKLDNLQLFPQGVSVILARRQLNLNITIPNEYPDFVGIDIGSFTVITTPFEGGTPNPAKSEVYELGVFCMCDHIISRVKDKYGITLKRMQVISVLKRKKTVLTPETVDYINSLAEKWTIRIINELRQNGLEFRATPVIFMGGGSQLLKSHLDNNTMIGEHEYISDVNMNAKAYNVLLKLYN